MAGPLRNGCVARGALNNAGSMLVFTCPADHAIIVKAVHLVNLGAAAADLTCALRSGDGAATLQFVNIQLASLTAGAWYGWTAMGPGDQMIMYASVVTSAQIWVAGALLAQVPSTTTLPLPINTVVLEQQLLGIGGP